MSHTAHNKSDRRIVVKEGDLLPGKTIEVSFETALNLKAMFSEQEIIVSIKEELETVKQVEVCEEKPKEKIAKRTKKNGALNDSSDKI